MDTETPAPTGKTRQEIVADFRAKAEAAILSQLQTVDVTAFTEEIIRDLNRTKADVVWKLLGLDNRWGKWEVDHCNGRESPISRYISDSAQSTVQQWVNDAVVEVLTAERDKAKSAIKTAVRDEVRRVVYDRHQHKVYDIATAYASELANEALNEIRNEVIPELADKPRQPPRRR